MEDTIKKTAEELFEKIGVKASVEVKKEDDVYNIFVDSQDNALIIGKHGNTLSSFELILSLIVTKKTGEYKRLIIEVGGYRKEREDYLTSLVEKLRESIVATGIERSVRDLKPWERRFIHLLLKDDEKVTTESVGEARERTLIIKKK